jgi:hypothetical protein
MPMNVPFRYRNGSGAALLTPVGLKTSAVLPAEHCRGYPALRHPAI